MQLSSNTTLIKLIRSYWAATNFECTLIKMTWQVLTTPVWQRPSSPHLCELEGHCLGAVLGSQPAARLLDHLRGEGAQCG
jgi:hypothetical protein